ncbi:uncharacterized protein LOC108906018 [Anoplophora glabripennis]|uniref:uncharacterized protein LOC108906018 n=1 Tax=Anoplophora glabripennis TaxID=217634 RepID=UPI0008758E29|nr:uncharacterized protein LOC108906018 [Anoplophora glabripennis]
MGSLTNEDKKLFENSISYLHNISGLNCNPAATPALKCLHLTKARLMELRRHIRVPSRTTTATNCVRCFLSIDDGPASFRIKAEEKKSRFARRILSKKQKDKPMTKFQRKYLKRLRQFNGNQLVVSCKFCKKEYFVNMDKPKNLIHTKRIKTSQRKKNKKKDIFCGLNEDVVLSLTPEYVEDLDTSDFIPLEGNRKLSRIKLSKKRKLQEPIEEVVTKESIRQNQNKVKAKNKLKEFLNTSGSSKSSPSANLKHFLKSL